MLPHAIEEFRSSNRSEEREEFGARPRMSYSPEGLGAHGLEDGPPMIEAIASSTDVWPNLLAMYLRTAQSPPKLDRGRATID